MRGGGNTQLGKQCKPNDSVTMETQPLGPPLWFTGREMSLSGASQLYRTLAVTLRACPAQATRHPNHLCGIPPDERTPVQSVLPQKGELFSHTAPPRA